MRSRWPQPPSSGRKQAANGRNALTQHARARRRKISAMSKTISRQSSQRRLTIYAALVVLTLVAFWQVRGHEFLNFDDDVYVTENVQVQGGLTPESIAWAFTTMDAEFWHPLTWLSLMLDAEIYGLAPGGFHTTNLMLHILSTLLLFWLFSRMTGAVWPSAFVAALFGIHPLHVESVVWIAERKDVLSGFFWMLTLCLYVRYTEMPTVKRYLPVVMSFACALLSKSMVVTLPVILVLLDYWPLGRLWKKKPAMASAPSAKQKQDQSRKPAKAITATLPALPQDDGRVLWGNIPLWQILEKAPFFILSLLFVGLTLLAQDALNVESWPLGARIANAFVSYMAYVAHIFIPLGLAVFYPFDLSLPVWKIGLCVFLFFSITVAVIAAAKRLPHLPVGWFWFVVTLLPVIGFIQVGNHSWADRYAYLSSIGMTIMLAFGLPLLIKSKRWRQRIFAPLGVAFVMVLTVLTIRQVGFWQNSISLYERALEVTKNNALAHYNLASAYVDHGKIEEAKPHFREAIRIRPEADTARVNLGAALAAEGNYEEAIALYLEAIAINSQNEVTFSNLGSAYADLNRLEEAQKQYLRAIEINPRYGDAHFNYANLLMRQGRPDEAAVHYRLAVEMVPDHIEAHHALADLLAGQGKSAEAVAHYVRVVQARPGDFSLLNNLGVTMDKQGRYIEAIDYYRRALDIEPNNPGVHYNLAIALLRTGDMAGGRAHLRRSLEIQPDFMQAREALQLTDEIEGRSGR